MKKTKVIIPALGILLLSTAASVTGTVAWFSANNQVTATGMKVQAKAESGIVISNAATGDYDYTATSAKESVSALKPGSTADLTHWYHSTSTNPSSANTKQAYDEGVEDTHYVIHDFYVKSSSNAAASFTSFDVKSITVATATQDLSLSLRVGVKTTGSSNVYLFAPVAGATTTYTVAGATGAYNADNRVEANIVEAGSADAKDTSVTSFPARVDSANNVNPGTHVGIYLWFEGEDAHCISDNIDATLEQLTVTVVFGVSGLAA